MTTATIRVPVQLQGAGSEPSDGEAFMVVDVVTVTNCCDCDYAHFYAHSGGGETCCTHPRVGDWGDVPLLVKAPEWCPLRKRPALVVLKEAT